MKNQAQTTIKSASQDRLDGVIWLIVDCEQKIEGMSCTSRPENWVGEYMAGKIGRPGLEDLNVSGIT